MTTVTKQPPTLTAGLSMLALQLARELDRLPAGQYEIALVKERDRWTIQITKREQVRDWELTAIKGTR